MKIGKIDTDSRRDIRRQLANIVMRGLDYCEARISEEERGTCVYCLSNSGQEIMRAIFSEKGKKELYSINVFYHVSCINWYNENPSLNKQETKSSGKTRNDSNQTQFNFD